MKRSRFYVKKAAALLLAAALCLCTVKQLHAYTAYERTRTLVASVRKTCTITAWHYSGGYWMADNGSGEPRVRITDETVSRYGFSKALSMNISADWTVRIPEEVRQARRDGAVIVTDVPENGQYHSGIRSTVYGGEELRIRAEPIIRTSGKSLKDYVPGIRADIPLISLEHGRNLYALYGKGLKGSTAPGAYSQSRPEKVFEPYIHPSMIKNAIGTLAEGGYVYAAGKTLPSKGISVGLLTLINGGAVGVQLTIPIVVRFYAETLVKVTRDAETAVPQDAESPETAPVPDAEEPQTAPDQDEQPEAPVFNREERQEATASEPEERQESPVPDREVRPEAPSPAQNVPRPPETARPDPGRSQNAPVLPDYLIHRAY